MLSASQAAWQQELATLEAKRVASLAAYDAKLATINQQMMRAGAAIAKPTAKREVA